MASQVQRKKTYILILAFTLMLCCSCDEQTTQKGNAPNPQAIDKTNSSQIAMNEAKAFNLSPPIAIVDAAEFSDGGTTYVKLQDSAQKELLFFVSEKAFAKTIPANTLFLGAAHPHDPNARLPRNREEASKVITALELAINSAIPKSKRSVFQDMGDPLENYWAESYGKPAEEQRSKEVWVKIFAFDALRRLKANSDLAIYNQKDSLQPDWYEQFDTQRSERLAQERQEAEQDAHFKEFYPASARKFLSLSSGENAVTFSPVGANPRESDSPEAEQGKKLAEAIDDPIRLAEMTCNALGLLNESWNQIETRDQIAIQAMLTVKPDQFAAAIPKAAESEHGLLGAARVFFYFRYGEQLPSDEWEKWAPAITEISLNKGVDDNKSSIIGFLARTKHAGATPLLRKVARGEIGTEPDLAEQFDEEPGLCELAYLGLALRGDDLVAQEITQLLPNARIKQNQAALEVALALLGNPAFLTAKNMNIDSHSICFAFLSAVERFDGKHGMDILMSSGLDHHYAAVANGAILRAQRITAQQWIPEGTNFHPSKYAPEAKAWWKANREIFLSK